MGEPPAAQPAMSSEGGRQGGEVVAAGVVVASERDRGHGVSALGAGRVGAVGAGARGRRGPRVVARRARPGEPAP